MSSAFRLSIGINLALAGIVAVLLWRGQASAPSPVAPPARTISLRPEPPKPGALAEAIPSKLTEAKPNLAALASLEQLGISREILVNALLENFNRRASLKVVALQKKYAPKAVPDREYRDLSRQSDVERMRELKEALGEEGYQAWDKEQTLRELNRARPPGDESPMSPEEAEQAYRLQKEFDQNTKELQLAMEDGLADKADVGTLQARAQETLDRALEKLLGPKRFNEIRGNTEPATEVYRTFGDLNPTPEQAKAVLQAEGDYRVREATLTKRLNENSTDAVNVAAELKAMADAREQTYRQLFGAEAYDRFKVEHDPTYQTLKQYADAWNLNGDEVQQVYHSVNAFQQQAEHLRAAAALNLESGQKVDWKVVNAGIEQARQQTERGLQSTIGPERLRRLKQNGLLADGSQ